MSLKHPFSLAAVAILCLPLFGISTAHAAPPSPLLLEDLAKEYTVRGLPLPPKAARLVVYQELTGSQTVMNGLQPVTTPLFTSRLAIEAAIEPELEAPEFRGPFPRAVEVTPAPGAADGVVLSDEESLVLAIRCHILGWKDLAQVLLNRSFYRGFAPPGKQLVQVAYRYWDLQLTYPQADRLVAFNQLKALVAENPYLNTYDTADFLLALDATLVPSKAAPASVEALIDSFVDYTDINDIALAHRGRFGRISAASGVRPAVALVGFEAVPALIAHINDARLTRAIDPIGFNSYRHIRVGELARGLLKQIAGVDYYGPFSDRDITLWWNVAQPVSEKAYLLNLITPIAPNVRTFDYTTNYLVELAVVRYPEIIPVLYRRVLDESPQFPSQMLAAALVRAKLPDPDKIDLFIYGTKHPDTRHRAVALRGLQAVAPMQANNFIITALDTLPVDVIGPYANSPEVAIAALANGSNDPLVWVAVEKAANRSVVGLRIEILAAVGAPMNDNHQIDRLKLLTTFLNDVTIRDLRFGRRYDGAAAFRYTILEVRDFAALQIAQLLGLPVSVTDFSPAADFVAFRTQVQAALQAELGKGKP